MNKKLFLLISYFTLIPGVEAQTQVKDSLEVYTDSLLRELPELLVTGEHPIVKARQGKLIYDLPRLIADKPVSNVYEAIRELPAVVEMADGLTLGGQPLNVVIDGKVTTMSAAQLTTLLKTIPASRIENAEVMYAAPARYQVRGAMVNIVLKPSTGTSPKWQGELMGSLQQKHYAETEGRANLLYTSSRFSADLLYSHSGGKSYGQDEKEAVHTLADGSVHPMNTWGRSVSHSDKDNARLGLDYHPAKNHSLSLVYTAQWSHGGGNHWVDGAEQSHTRSLGSTQLHNIQLNYTAPFGLQTGLDYTYFQSPGSQWVSSELQGQYMDFMKDDLQRINKLKAYVGQEWKLPQEWSINAGGHYTTATDHSYQYYYDRESGKQWEDGALNTRQREQTVNLYAGLGKNFGSKLSIDVSFAAEYFHNRSWNEWAFYPTLNMNYMPADGQMFQLSVSGDRSYPPYWSVQDAVNYIGAYSEIHGNPLLKPSTEYNADLTYVWRSKYQFTVFYSKEQDYFVQTLYQSPHRLAEIYKTLNFDYRQKWGVRASVPYGVGKWLAGRLTLIGIYDRQKDSDFWTLSFDRRRATAIAISNTTFTLSSHPDLRLTLYAFYQDGANQGLYTLPRSGNVDVSLRWTFAHKQAQLTLKGADLFDTSGMSPRINYAGQFVHNRYLDCRRTLSLTATYRFGNYKERRRTDVDTSRFK